MGITPGRCVIPRDLPPRMFVCSHGNKEAVHTCKGGGVNTRCQLCIFKPRFSRRLPARPCLLQMSNFMIHNFHLQPYAACILHVFRCDLIIRFSLSWSSAGDEPRRVRGHLGGHAQAARAVHAPEHPRCAGHVGQGGSIPELAGRRHAAALH